MENEYTNKMIYEFLSMECKTILGLWDEFKDGLIAHTTDADFLERLSDVLNCFRICDECGKPMIEGFVIEGCDTYCSEECLHKHIPEEVYNDLYDNGNGESYWTTWYEDSNTYKNN